MGSNFSDSVGSQYYNKHTRGGKVAYNPSEGRLGVLQRMHMKTFTEMAMNRFEWTGLPTTIDQRYLEHTLFYSALVVFFRHENFGDIVLRGSGQGVNMYGNPLRFTVFGNKFVQRTLSAEEKFEVVKGEPVNYPPECVPIYSNYLRTPDLDYAMVYAHKLADIDLTIEINAHNARYTRVITSSESQKLSAANLNRELDKGSPVVFVSDLMNPETVGSIDIAVDPDIHVNLPILRTRLHADAMSLFGINNSNQDKKERLVADEVAANNDQVAVMRAINLNARQEACTKINRLFGTNIWVEYKTDGEVVDSSTQLPAMGENDAEDEAAE